MRRKSSHRSIWRLSAKLAYLPSLYLSPQGTISSFDGGKAAKTYSVPVTASWEIDIFGKLRNAKRQSQALYAQSQDYRQAVRTQVIAGIANTYYTLLMLDAQLEISEQTKISWKESADATRALMNAGRADNSAVSQMEAAYYSVCASVLDLKEQINQVENSMSLLLASTPHTIERGKLDTLNIPTSFSTGIPVQLLSNRPDVRAAKRSLEQAFYAANQARSAFYPSITLSGSAGGQAGTEVNNALTQYQTARDKSALYEKQVESLQTAYKSTSLTMQYGNTTYLEVLTAQQSLLSAQLTQVANRITEIQGLISLYQALGGGCEE